MARKREEAVTLPFSKAHQPPGTPPPVELKIPSHCNPLAVTHCNQQDCSQIKDDLNEWFSPQSPTEHLLVNQALLHFPK